MVKARGLFLREQDFSKSSFLSCEKDLELILRKLFVESKPYSDQLKRLLVINNKDCLDNEGAEYQEIINSHNLKTLTEGSYIRTIPKITFGQHEEIKSYILIEFNNFSPTSNPQYRDCLVDITIICHSDAWDLGNYRLRPIKIMGYIDGLLDGARLTGIGTLNFVGATEVVLDEALSGYLLRYAAVHGSDDRLEDDEE